jgi:hypothetical protein
MANPSKGGDAKSPGPNFVKQVSGITEHSAFAHMIIWRANVGITLSSSSPDIRPDGSRYLFGADLLGEFFPG